jgi:rhodanese-related sulfurtransferase
MAELAARAGEIPRDRTILVVCRSGSRSLVVGQALADAGYDAVNLAGGLAAWLTDDLPLIADDGLPGTVI